MNVDKNYNFFEFPSSMGDISTIPVKLLWSDCSGERPLISICIPTYKRPELLLEAIQSALKQTDTEPFEIIVVDNDPDQPAQDVIAKLSSLGSKKIKYYKNAENLGMFGNWNRCLTLATSDWITILNDDDFLDSDFLASALRIARMRSSAHMISFANRMIDQRPEASKGKIRLHGLKNFIRNATEPFKPKLFRLVPIDYFFSSHHAGTLGVIFRRQSALTLGGFNQMLSPSADHIFWTHFITRFESYFCPEPKCSYRVLANESLKGQTLVGWVQQGYWFRFFLLRKVLFFPFVSSFFAITTAVETVRNYREFWGEHNVENEALANIPIRRFHRTKIAQYLNWTMKALYRALRF